MQKQWTVELTSFLPGCRVRQRHTDLKCSSMFSKISSKNVNFWRMPYRLSSQSPLSSGSNSPKNVGLGDIRLCIIGALYCSRFLFQEFQEWLHRSWNIVQCWAYYSTLRKQESVCFNHWSQLFQPSRSAIPIQCWLSRARIQRQLFCCRQDSKDL